MIPAQKIIVALDTKDSKELDRLLRAMEGSNVWVKVGMELFYALGPDAIFQAKRRNFKVFLDLKLHDIPNTVHQALKSLMDLPIDMVNVHAAGGREMMLRAAEAVKSKQTSPLLIAVTQLTSTSNEQMNTDQRIPGDLMESVAHFAKMAKACGCDGVVSSPHEISRIKKDCGSNFLTVTPGIRTIEGQQNDQKRVTTPSEALRLGTDFMVIGRPITGAIDPKEALAHILEGK